VIALHAIIDELAVAFGANNPERRHLALGNSGGKLDEHLPSIVKSP
jgi:hypothetical protein